jgi:(p)ppGpp synthase/HD superfamily hydrolase
MDRHHQIDQNGQQAPKDTQAILNAVGKKIHTLRSRLLGAAHESREWYLAVDSLEFAIEKHEGMFRADGITPYIVHPVEVASYAFTLPRLIRPVHTISSLLMHDTMEDCSVAYQTLADRFGSEIADGVEVMSKVVDGSKKTLDQYAKGLAASVIGSIGKACDRVNNQSTMSNFTPERQLKQVTETEELVLPVIKIARRRFPQQELAYENAKLVLKTQNALIRAMHREPIAA